jgi:hypothetical protein
MKSVAIFPLDFYYDSTVRVTQWLENDFERHDEYVRACVEYARNPHYEAPLRCEPHVAYNVFDESYYFIFKQDNNGTCILVGEKLPPIPNDMKIDVPEQWEMT